MDTRQWQVFPVNEEAHRKRQWNVISSSNEAIPPRSRFDNTFQDEREPAGPPEWKRRRSIVQTEPRNSSWGASEQTSLWLAQQNSLEPVPPMGREIHSQSHHVKQYSEPEHRSATTMPPEAPRHWPRYAEDVERPLTEGNNRSSGMRLSSISERPSK
jgi:hypothetical protein